MFLPPEVGFLAISKLCFRLYSYAFTLTRRASRNKVESESSPLIFFPSFVHTRIVELPCRGHVARSSFAYTSCERCHLRRDPMIFPCQETIVVEESGTVLPSTRYIRALSRSPWGIRMGPQSPCDNSLCKTFRTFSDRPWRVVYGGSLGRLPSIVYLSFEHSSGSQESCIHLYSPAHHSSPRDIRFCRFLHDPPTVLYSITWPRGTLSTPLKSGRPSKT